LIFVSNYNLFQSDWQIRERCRRNCSFSIYATKNAFVKPKTVDNCH
jgi:hypothetical protein